MVTARGREKSDERSRNLSGSGIRQHTPARDKDNRAMVTLVADAPVIEILGFRDVALGERDELFRRRSQHIVVSCLDTGDWGTEDAADLSAPFAAAVGDQVHRFIAFPIPDGGTPRSLFATLALIGSLGGAGDAAAKPPPVLFGCFAGCGRSGMLAACLLAARGRSTAQALTDVDQRRREDIERHLRTPGHIVENPAQRVFVDRFARLWGLLSEADEAAAAGLIEAAPEVVGWPSRAEYGDLVLELLRDRSWENFVRLLTALGASQIASKFAAELIAAATPLRSIRESVLAAAFQGAEAPILADPVADSDVSFLARLASNIAMELPDEPVADLGSHGQEIQEFGARSGARPTTNTAEETSLARLLLPERYSRSESRSLVTESPDNPSDLDKSGKIPLVSKQVASSEHSVTRAASESHAPDEPDSRPIPEKVTGRPKAAATSAVLSGSQGAALLSAPASTEPMEFERDKVFEKFLADKRPSEYVERIARLSYYTVDLFRVLFPEDTAKPPAIVNPGPTGPTGPTPGRLRYPIEMIEEADSIVEEFDGTHDGHRRHYLSDYDGFSRSKVR